MSKEVQCDGLGLGLTVYEGEIVAFLALGDTDEDSPAYVLRLPLDRLNHVIGTMMSVANEMASLEREMSEVPLDDRAAFIHKLCERYNFGAN